MNTWLEMSRDEVHGGLGWSFGERLWVPTRKRNGARSRYWDTLRRVQENDLIIHLRGRDDAAAFVACSLAAGDGEETSERPPEPEPWEFSNRFLRVPLREFTHFDQPIPLRPLFRGREDAFRKHYLENAQRPPTERRSIFYAIQAGRLQCLNGAYLSEMDNRLTELCFGWSELPGGSKRTSLVGDVITGEQLQAVRGRLGQVEFSAKVRHNYRSHCCFPECAIKDATFLVGAHIARWADHSALRGKLENGICFCLMHDKAFERGLFVIDHENKIRVNRAQQSSPQWVADHLTPFDGHAIRLAGIKPSIEALRLHWHRVGFTNAPVV